MKAIPAEMYEAAAVDGATALQRFGHVTLPALQNNSIIVVPLSTIWTFNDFTIYAQIRNLGLADSLTGSSPPTRASRCRSSRGS